MSFYTPIPGVTAYTEITMAKVSEKEPYWIPVIIGGAAYKEAA